MRIRPGLIHRAAFSQRHRAGVQTVYQQIGVAARLAKSEKDAIHSQMRTSLHELEHHLLRGPVDTARVLGVSYSNYAAMKAGTRRVPVYVRFHAEALMRLPAAELNELVRKRLDG